ncbi:multidrug resistance protein MdtO [Paraburkholderia sp. BL6669N2]|uniref:FUSC family protein n=1 Tax=Paraburkholderia sp. BL6669N2 TaxID=1938807 RepID=UPI000E362C4A|nr:FUSC family protein [Paraburkholderia sp. BL6669N2]REG52137.1 multidrug resistance protein MdtO [Paraburkholderia sp. BL6669N2]
MKALMDATGYLPSGLLRFAGLLGDEVRSYPGRANLMLRCLLASAIVIIVSMAFQVPFLALSLVVVFFVTQSNVVMTRLIGVLFMLGATLGIGSAILVFKLTYDYPLLRILMSVALFFLCVYMTRVTKVGAVFFLVGIFVIYLQSFVDMTDQPEALVRISLWIWVAESYAIAVTLVINTLCLPAEPARQLESAMLGQLAAVDARLTALESGAPSPGGIDAGDVQAGMLTLQKLLRFSTMRDRDFRRCQTFHLARVTAVSRLFAAAAHLPDDAVGVQAGVVRALREACKRLAKAIQTGTHLTLPDALTNAADEGMPGALREMQNALRAFADRSATPDSNESEGEKERLFVPDAFSNPVYGQFALKTLLAAMLGYLFYLATDWQGIHTIMLTSLIVAQPSLGATGRRSILRLVGAAIGSIIALIMVVCVVPRIDGIVGLLLMSLPVLALGAWLTAGSERISYAGTQLMFTFSLALLEQFGPTSNLTEIRDRMIGIVLGVAISAVVHATLWPEAEGEALRQRIARLLRRLAAQLRQQGDKAAPAALWAELGDCEAMAARVALEPGWQLSEGQQEEFQIHVQTMLAQTREILLAAHAFDAERRAQPVKAPGADRAAAIFGERAGASLECYALDLTERPEAVRAPTPVPPDSPATSWRVDQAASRTETAQVAYERLIVRAKHLIEQVSTLPGWSVASADTTFITRASQA